MKSFAIAAALLFSSASALANDAKFVNSDGSALSDLCIAAVASDKNIPALAETFGIKVVSAEEIACNGRPIVDFVRKYSSFEADAPVAVRTSYIISSGNEAPETQLCLAALHSEEEYARVKAAHFAGVSNVEQTINCNNMPLNRFVRKYRDRLAADQSVNTASL